MGISLLTPRGSEGCAGSVGGRIGGETPRFYQSHRGFEHVISYFV